MAMVSETLRLASDERDAVCDFVCQTIGARGATVISVGAESSFVAERHARHAERCGATMLMAIPPVAVALDEEAIADYYRRLIRAVTIPVIVQDASGYVGRPMSIELQVRLMEEFDPERVQFKNRRRPPLAERLGQLRRASSQCAQCYEGSGGVALIETFPHGLAGTMPGADLIRGIVALWRALERHDAHVAQAIHAPLAKLIELQKTLDAYLAWKSICSCGRASSATPSSADPPAAYVRRRSRQRGPFVRRPHRRDSMIIDVHSHAWRFPQDFSQDFIQQAQRARQGTGRPRRSLRDYAATASVPVRTIVFGGKAA